MDHKFAEYLYDSFTKLEDEFGFVKSMELNEEEAYSIEYCSDNFVVVLEKYRRQFYVALYKTGHTDKGVDLFNLFQYLNQTSSNAPEYKFFEEEKDIGKCYKMQFDYITDTICKKFTIINEFFKDGNYELKMTNIGEFMVNRYPNLFKRPD